MMNEDAKKKIDDLYAFHCAFSGEEGPSPVEIREALRDAIAWAYADALRIGRLAGRNDGTPYDFPEQRVLDAIKARAK